MAGNDVIFGGLGGDGDLIAGDALSSHDVGGDATANNEATTESVGGSLALSLAGNDALVAGRGNDTIAGDALSLGGDATANNEATVTGGHATADALAIAGNDLIVSEVEELTGGGEGRDACELVADQPAESRDKISRR